MGNYETLTELCMEEIYERKNGEHPFGDVGPLILAGVFLIV
jgi:hypothetical protein